MGPFVRGADGVLRPYDGTVDPPPADGMLWYAISEQAFRVVLDSLQSDTVPASPEIVSGAENKDSI